MVLRSIRRAGGSVLDAIARRSLLARDLQSFIRFRQTEKYEPLLVFTFGKVASSTLVVSLQANSSVSSRYWIYPVHRLSASGVEFVKRASADARARLRGTSNPKRRYHPQHARLGRWLRRRITDPRNRRQWLVITLVRDPVSRNVSSFFQNLVFRLGFDYEARLQSESQETVVADIRRLFEKHYLDGRSMERLDSSPLTWFDAELKSVFGVDVYASEFPKKKGYQIYESERARVLLMRLEDLDRVHSAAMKEFLGIDDFALVNANEAESKAYSELYGIFRRGLTLPPEYFREFYDSRYARHFYTDEEIQVFRSKWKTRQSPSPVATAAASSGA
jgi:hypothetical protein